MTKKPLLKREVDNKVLPPYWRKAVYVNKDLPQGAVDRDAYVVCVLEQLYRALVSCAIFASRMGAGQAACGRRRCDRRRPQAGAVPLRPRILGVASHAGVSRSAWPVRRR